VRICTNQASLKMHDLNDLYFFAAVVQHNGFTAAARATGLEKTRLSRRVAELEQRVGLRLLQRSTRSIALTEGGERFYARCVAAVESADAAYDSVAELQKEPSGTVRLACPVVMAQNYLAPVLPGYLARHAKVNLLVDATDRTVNLIEERFDLALRGRSPTDAEAGMVVKSLGTARLVLVASPAFIAARGRPQHPKELAGMEVISHVHDMHEGNAHWRMKGSQGTPEVVKVHPRLATSDFSVLLEAAVHGIGVAFLPEPIVATALQDKRLEQVLPDWVAAGRMLQLVYPPPRGMLPAVRSLIDYLVVHLPPRIHGS
jgi:DNA-binding transcriptional LysR family regulator